MSLPIWDQIRLSPGREDQVWELFHENSKTGRHSRFLTREEVLAHMRQLHESLPFDHYPSFPLPPPPELRADLTQAILERRSARALDPREITLDELAALLHLSYGVTFDNRGTPFPRPLRAVPSGGALYPLEIFFHARSVRGLPAGLHHYDPVRHQVHLLREGDETEAIAAAVVQGEILQSASLVLFLTAIFERSVFKYGDRGYRFVLIEAGHVAQNVNLVAGILGLASLNLGGFFDREIDGLLGIDGLTHSTLYLQAIGGRHADAAPPEAG